MLDLFLNIILVTLASSGVISIWFYSPLKCSLAKLFFNIKDCWDNSKFDNMLSLKSKSIGFLSGCHFCIFFWSSLFFSILLQFIPGKCISFLEIIISVFASNFLHYILNKYIHGR